MCVCVSVCVFLHVRGHDPTLLGGHTNGCYETQSGLICIYIMPDGAIQYKVYRLIDNGCW